MSISFEAPLIPKSNTFKAKPATAYQDIINLDRPISKRPKMPLSQRAKIFAPFAALQAYNESIADREEDLIAKDLDPEIINEIEFKEPEFTPDEDFSEFDS